ncbi:MAG: hypothetical protein HY286_06240 [Planctomycetes bacterium]|nr:hypothetical protein [Planctomycetota bacterium]
METLRARSVGEILDASLRLTFRRFWLYVGMSFFGILPAAIFVGIAAIVAFIVANSAGSGNVTNSFFTWFAIIGGVGGLILLIPLMWWTGVWTGATYHALAMEATGRRATMRESFEAGRKRPFSMIMVDFVLGISACFCCIPIPFFWPAPPAVALEDINWTGALGRSSMLTEGRRWQVFGLFLVMLLLGMVLTMPLTAPIAIIEVVFGRNGLTPGLLILTVFLRMIQFAVSYIMGIFTRAAQTLCYLDLRVRKEGLDVELAAQTASQGTQS